MPLIDLNRLKKGIVKLIRHQRLKINATKKCIGVGARLDGRPPMYLRYKRNHHKIRTGTMCSAPFMSSILRERW